MKIPFANASIVLASIVSLLTTPPAVVHPLHPVVPKNKATAHIKVQDKAAKTTRITQRQAVSDFSTEEEVEIERYRLKSKVVSEVKMREMVVG